MKKETRDKIIEEFLEIRKKAFETFTEESLREFSLRYEITIPKNMEVFWLGAHRARIHMTNIEVKYIKESIKWLTDRGYDFILTSEVQELLEAANF